MVTDVLAVSQRASRAVVTDVLEAARQAKTSAASGACSPATERPRPGYPGPQRGSE
jgi:hypothetical protein